VTSKNLRKNVSNVSKRSYIKTGNWSTTMMMYS